MSSLAITVSYSAGSLVIEGPGTPQVIQISTPGTPGVVQLGTLSAAVNQQITQAVASTTASATTATAAASTATTEAGVATAAAGTATAQAAIAAEEAEAAAASATASANAYSAISAGAATSYVGPYTGNEVFSFSAGGALYSNPLQLVAQWTLSGYQGYAPSGTGAVSAPINTKLARNWIDYADYNTFANAVTRAAATGQPIILPASALTLNLTSDFIIPAGVQLRGIPGSTSLTVTGNFSLRAGGSNVRLSGMSINGGAYGFHANGQANVTLEDVIFTGSSNHTIYLNGAGAKLRRIEVHNAGASSCVIDGATNVNIDDFLVDNGANFGIWGINASNSVRLDNVRCTTQNGLELIGQRYNCYQWQLTNILAMHCGDNGISITGYDNTLNNIEAYYNHFHGVCLYGLRNSLGSHRCDNNGQVNATMPGSGIYAGVSVTPAFAGAGRENAIGNGRANDTQGVPTQSYGYLLGGNAYVTWTSGGAVTNANLIRQFGNNVYSTPSPGTCGSTPPTWTINSSGAPITQSDGNLNWTFVYSNTSIISRLYQPWTASTVVAATDPYRVNANKLYVATSAGTSGTTAPTWILDGNGNPLSQSDGGLTWTFVTEFPGNLDAFDNTVSNVGGFGNASGLFKDGTAGNKNHVDVPGLKQIGHPLRNLWASWLVGSGTPNGNNAAQPGSFKSRLDVSDPGISFWVKQSGANTNTGWLQGASVQVGTTASRPNYSASYGSGANGITYTNTTLGHLETFINPNWVNAGTGATE